MHLKHANNLPVIDVGKPGKPIFLPAEVCEIFAGQMFKGKLSPDATRGMLQVASNRPDVNRGFIENEGLKLLGLKENTAVLTPMGIQVNPQMTATPARILPPPKVTYKAGSQNVRIDKAGWNILNVKFHEPADMSRWAVLLVKDGRRGEFRDANDPELKTFLDAFGQKCRNSGLTVGSPVKLATPALPCAEGDSGRRSALKLIQDTLEKHLDMRSKQTKPRLILVLLSDVDDFIYPGIKRMCDMQLGILTQTMLTTPKKARVPNPKKQDQYFSNVALKVNVKLGGANHLLADDETQRWLKQKKTMLVGIDVTHPSPTSAKGTPSIVSVLASIDDKFVQFPVSMGLQRNRNVNKNAEEVSALLCGREARV